MKIQTIGQELRTSNKQNYNRQPAFRRNWSEHVSWGANYVKETGKTRLLQRQVLLLQLIKFYQKMVIQLFIKWSIKAMEFMK